jgi:hypothetical protein
MGHTISKPSQTTGIDQQNSILIPSQHEVPENQSAITIFSGHSNDEKKTEISYGTVLENYTRVTKYVFPPFPFPLPRKVDLRVPGRGCYPYPPIRSQKSSGTCTSQSIITAAECWIRFFKQDMTTDLSVLYNYYYARKIVGDTKRDSGTSVRAALNASVIGICLNRLWEFDMTRINVQPSAEAQEDALLRNTVEWETLDSDLANLKSCLYLNYPIIFSLQVTDRLDDWFKHEDQQVQTNYFLPVLRQLHSVIIGAHTVLIVAYDDDIDNGNGTGGFLCRNSWGPQWGLQGHFWIAYNSIVSPSIDTRFHFLKEFCISNVKTKKCVSPEQCHNAYSQSFCKQYYG